MTFIFGADQIKCVHFHFQCEYMAKIARYCQLTMSSIMTTISSSYGNCLGWLRACWKADEQYIRVGIRL